MRGEYFAKLDILSLLKFTVVVKIDGQRHSFFEDNHLAPVTAVNFSAERKLGPENVALPDGEFRARHHLVGQKIVR